MWNSKWNAVANWRNQIFGFKDPTKTFRSGGIWKDVSLLLQMKGGFLQINMSILHSWIQIYCWEHIFCEKIASFMKHLLKLKRITSGHLFSDLLNRRLNISENKAFIENGEQSRHVFFFSYVLSLILMKKRKILLLGLHAIFCLGWNETKVSITTLK